MNGLRILVFSALILLVAGAAWARVGTLVQQAPPKAKALRNPFAGDELTQRAGAKLFARNCSACHGSEGTGSGKTPPLNQADVRDASPGALFWVLRNGSLNRGMPSFAHLPAPQRWQIITYLKSLKER